MIEQHYEGAASLARRIAARELSSTEAVAACLARIVQVNQALNALVQLDADRAIASARAADQALASGRVLGPLHGVPFTVKDWIDAAGLRCTGGELQHRERVPAADATCVARVRAAGAVLLGKTNVMVGNEVYGRVNNPYDLAFSTTGSSSGDAALVAAGGTPLGFGSDSGGSIRQPAHACGVAGLKPTAGRVPLTGHFPFISAMNDPRTVIGPLARSVEDLALALAVISGPDLRDPSAVPAPLGDWRTIELRGLRVATYTHHAGASPSPEVAEVCRRAATALERAGAYVDEVLPPRIEEAWDLTLRYWARPESTSPDEWVPDAQATLASMDVERHLFEWDRFRRVMLDFMSSYDLIVTPPAEQPATRHGEPAGGIPYTVPYSLTGWPAAVVRGGESLEGLPIGVQIVARPWREDVALAAAAQIERELGGWRAPRL